MGSSHDDQISELFNDALALPEAERARFLGDSDIDETIRRRVQELLSAHPKAAHAFAHQLAAEVGDASVAATDPMVGRTVGRFTIREVLGQGGMGRVYLAERSDAEFHQRVAIKLVRPGFDTQHFLRRFAQERDVLAQLEHPGIARLIDGGSTEEGLPYLVMEYVDGLPLDVYCDRNSLSLQGRITKFIAVCEVVHFAHQNLIVHRDLKPGNVLIDGSGQVKLLDFGVAKFLDANHASASTATQTIMRMITPRYASPEQLKGERITTATDVYSLGLVLYELAAGRPAFDFETRSARAIEEVICSKSPGLPSTVVADARLRRRLEGDLDTIILKALRKEPERRYGSAEELAEDLRRHQTGFPVQARPDSAGYRMSKFVRRNRLGVAATVAVMLALVAGMATTLAQYRRAQSKTSEAEALAYAASISAAESSIRDDQIDQARRELERAPAALRGWEWSHLIRRLNRSRVSVVAHEKGITGVRYLPTGDRILTCSADQSIKIWSTEGELLATSGPLSSELESFSVIPGEDRLIVGESNGTVTLRDLGDLAVSDVLHRGDSWAMVDAHPHGDFAAAGFRRGDARVWSLENREEIASRQIDDRFLVVRYQPDGQRLAVAGESGVLRIVEATSLTTIFEVPAHGRRIMNVVFSRDGSRVATSSMDRTVRVWSASSGEMLSSLTGHHATIVAISFGDDSRELISAGADRRILVWNTDTGEPVRAFRGNAGDVYCVDVSPDGRFVATGDWFGALQTWNWQTDDVRTLRVPEQPMTQYRVFQGALSPTGNRFVCAADAGGFWGWNLKGPHAVSLSTTWDYPCAVAFVDSFQVLSGHQTGRVWMTQWRTNTESFVFPQKHRSTVLDIELLPPGDAFATAGADSTIRIWNLSTRAQQDSLIGHRGAVYSLSATRDGRMISASRDSTIRIWELDGASTVLRGHGGPVRSVAVHADGNRVVSASEDGTVREWNTSTLRGHILMSEAGPLFAIGISPDGSRIATGGSDQMIRILDADSGREVARLQGHVARVAWLEFQPDGTLLSGAHDGTVRFWDVETSTLPGISPAVMR